MTSASLTARKRQIAQKDTKTHNGWRDTHKPKITATHPFTGWFRISTLQNTFHSFDATLQFPFVPCCSTVDSLELGAADGLGEALLGLVEVDDVPDGVEVLWCGRR